MDIPITKTSSRRFQTCLRLTETPGWFICILVLLLATLPISCDPTGEPASIILITMDTTRQDRIGCYGCDFASTPALDNFSNQATCFENAFTPIPVTLPSHLTMMTGHTPIAHGIRNNGWLNLNPDATTLAELLAANGYATAAFVSASVLSHFTCITEGFQVYDYDLCQERSADETTKSAVAFLEQNLAEPLFLWVHYFDPHDPYTPIEPFASATKGLPYDAEISAMDHSIGELLEAISKKELSDNSHIIIVADHGEGLSERADYNNHGLLLYDEACRVPFLWQMPNQTTGRRDSSLVGTVDIFPTILDLLEIDYPFQTEGISLRPQLRGRQPGSRLGLYSETAVPYLDYKWSPLYCWQTTENKYIASSEPELYDRLSDPGEINNLATSSPNQHQDLHQELLSYMHRWFVTPIQGAETLSEEERAKLESLGYIQPTAKEQDQTDVFYIPPIGELSGLASPANHIAVEKQFHDIIFARRHQRWQDIIDTSVAVLQKLPDSQAISRYYGEALLETSHPLEALKILDSSFQMNPHDVVIQRLYIRAMTDAGHYHDASSLLDKMDSTENDLSLCLTRMRISVMLGNSTQVDETIKFLQSGKFKHHPKISDWEAAADFLLELRENQSDITESVFIHQISALLELELLTEAQRLINDNVDILPEVLLVKLHGDIAYHRHDWLEAQTAYDKAINLGTQYDLHERLVKIKRLIRRQARRK